jgi:hypothetical protein
MRFAALGALLLCAACAATPAPTATAPAAPGDPLTALANFTITDLQNASADAKAHSDKLAAMCYDYLAAQLKAQAGAPGASVSGAVSAFQRVRDLQSAINSGVSQDFQVNCAPLLSDVRLNLIRLGVIGAGTAMVAP